MSVAPSTASVSVTPLLDDARLANSRAFCEQLTRRAARNFYYGLKLLPEPKRSAMFALYAYMRLVDDIAGTSLHHDRKPDGLGYRGGIIRGRRAASRQHWYPAGLEQAGPLVELKPAAGGAGGEC